MEPDVLIILINQLAKVNDFELQIPEKKERRRNCDMPLACLCVSLSIERYDIYYSGEQILSPG